MLRLFSGTFYAFIYIFSSGNLIVCVSVQLTCVEFILCLFYCKGILNIQLYMCTILKCMIGSIHNTLTGLGCRFMKSQIVIKASSYMNTY